MIDRIGDLDPFAGVAPGCITVVVETTRGRRSKLGYDPAVGAMRLRHVLPEGMAFPFDFGFVPGTQAGDGDPLDALLLIDEGLPTGTLLEARVIGVLEARQRRGDEPPADNHRLIAVAAVARAAAAVHGLDDLRPGLIDEIEAFLVQYNRMRGIRFEPLGRHGPERALQLVRDALTERAATGS